MDPLTHLMGGVVAAHALSGTVPEPAATIAAAATAVLADFDFYAHRYEGSAFLRIHHGVSHSIAGAAVAAAAVSGVMLGLLKAGLFAGNGFHFAAVWVVAFAGGLTHVLLDGVMHNNGILAGWPFTKKRWSIPLILAVNPRTVSPNCGDKRLTTCLVCQAKGALRNPATWMLAAGTAAGFLLPPMRNLVGMATWLLLALYLGAVLFFRCRAVGVAAATDPDFRRASPYPASVSPLRWCVVLEQRDGGFKAALVDAFSRSVIQRWHFPAPVVSSPLSQLIHRLRADLATVIRHPYPEPIRRNGHLEVRFKDLSYMYAYPMEIGTVRVKLSPEGEMIEEKYKEIW